MASTSDMKAFPGKAATSTITDNRTRKGYEIPIENGTIQTIDLLQIK